jgi:hypothetical protein
MFWSFADFYSHGLSMILRVLVAFYHQETSTAMVYHRRRPRGGWWFQPLGLCPDSRRIDDLLIFGVEIHSKGESFFGKYVYMFRAIPKMGWSFILMEIINALQISEWWTAIKGGPRPPRRAEPRHRGHRHARESRDATEPPGARAAAAAAASGTGTRHLGTRGPWRLGKNVAN